MLDLIGRYQVQEKIGEGAMADVYRAYDPSIRRPLAIKVLKAQYGQDQEYASRFLREAKAAGALSHANIVTIYDVGETEGHPYIVMELLEGEPLSDLLSREGQLAPSQVLSIASQLADALSYAHEVGVVHRDIKPSNIMAPLGDGPIKILDFGIARVNESDGLFEADHLKTRIGQVLGTPRYMSPEQALGQEIDGRSDLFSVGVVMYEMLTGKKAFGGSSAATLALQITQEDPEPISQIVASTPRGLQFIVSKLLSKRRDRRFETGRLLAAALRRERASYETAEAESKRYLPLQVRATVVMATVTAAVLALTVGVVLMRQDKVMRQMAITSGAAMTAFVANNAALKAVDNASLPLDRQDWLPVQAFVRAASGDKNVLDLKVIDSRGVIRGSSDPGLVGKPYSPPAGEHSEASDNNLTITSIKDPVGRQGFRFVEPITYAGRPFGAVDLTFSKAELQAASTLTHGLLVMLGVLVLGVVAAATYAASRALARPLNRLKQALNDGAAGDFNFRISHSRTDEFGELFDAFNRFSGAVQDRLDSIEAIALDHDPKATNPGVVKLRPASSFVARAEASLQPGHDGPRSQILSASTLPSPFDKPEGARARAGRSDAEARKSSAGAHDQDGTIIQAREDSSLH